MRDNPNLSQKQIDRIRSVAQLRSVQAGEVLYEPSQADVPLFIMLEGNVSISKAGEDDKILAVREASQFTGEMSSSPECAHCSRRASLGMAAFWNSVGIKYFH
jgi:thioredoxin reductase (NADPH)